MTTTLQLDGYGPCMVFGDDKTHFLTPRYFHIAISTDDHPMPSYFCHFSIQYSTLKILKNDQFTTGGRAFTFNNIRLSIKMNIPNVLNFVFQLPTHIYYTVALRTIFYKGKFT